MAKFTKIDMLDEENEVETTIEAGSLEVALEMTLTSLLGDDRLCPCYSIPVNETLRIEGNSIMFAPGDGGDYEIVVIEPLEPVA